MESSFHFSFLILVSRTPCTGDHPVTWPLPNTNREQMRTDINAFAQAKTFHALDCVAIVIGIHIAVGLLNTLTCSGNLSVTAKSIQNACENSVYSDVD
jgi:hypothetical protein